LRAALRSVRIDSSRPFSNSARGSSPERERNFSSGDHLEVIIQQREKRLGAADVDADGGPISFSFLGQSVPIAGRCSD
jgi:hypothetical protein